MVRAGGRTEKGYTIGGVLSLGVRLIARGYPHRVGFLRRFGLKTGIHFAHVGLESGMVYEGTTPQCMNVFIVSIPNE